MNFLGLNSPISLFLSMALVGALSSCVPLDKEKSELIYEMTTGDTPQVGTEPTPTPSPSIPPLEATFESINYHFIKKSCLSCHHGRQDFLPQFDTEEKIRDNAEDIIFYAQEGCDFDFCMPPLRDDGTPTKPVPSPEVMRVFKEWLDS